MGAGDTALRRGNSTWFLYVEPVCHGCDGKGWVSPTYGVAAICPACKGTGKPAPPAQTTYPTVNNDKWVVDSGGAVVVMTSEVFCY